MSRRTSIGCAASVLLALLWTQSSMAQGNCGAIQFTTAITSRFPNAKNACLDVVTRGAEQFAHFEARIVSVRGSEVTAEFKLPDGRYGNPVTFTPAPEARVRIAGTTYRYRDLSRGQELDVYVPSDRWAFAVQEDPTTTFAAAPTVTTVALVEPPQQVAATTLPRTGSSLPLLALIGLVSVALAGGVAGVRYRLRDIA